MSELIYNALRTPDGTIIESKSRHDYVTHTDANGKNYIDFTSGIGGVSVGHANKRVNDAITNIVKAVKSP